MQTYNPRLKEAVWRAQALLQEEERLLAPEVSRALQEVGEALTPDFYRLHLPGFLGLPVALQKLVVRSTLQKFLAEYPLSAAQVDAVLDLAQAKKSGGLISLGTCRVARAGTELHIFSRLPAPSRDPAWLPSSPGRFEAGGWRWRLAGYGQPPTGDRPPGLQIAWLDQDRLRFPLQVRHFQPGDRFWAGGAPGPKKLQDFLVDKKIPRWLRSYLPLVLSGEEIVWVAGLRVAEPAKLTGAGGNLLEMELSPGSADTRRIWEMLRACLRSAAGGKNEDQP